MLEEELEVLESIYIDELESKLAFRSDPILSLQMSDLLVPHLAWL